MKKAKIQKALKGLFCLDHNVKIYVPSTIDVNKKIDNSSYVKQALELFSDLFGGATSYDAKGAWLSKKGLVVEDVKIVESYATKEALEKGLNKVLRYAEKLKRELKQEAVSVEYDNKLYFI